MVAAAADRVVKRLLDTPLAVALLCTAGRGGSAAPGDACPRRLGGGSQPVEFELNLAECVVHFSSRESPVSSTPLPELSMEFVMPDAEGLGGLRQRATIAPGIVGTVSVPLVVPDDADELSVQVVGRWILPDEQRAEEFEVRTESQKL